MRRGQLDAAAGLGGGSSLLRGVAASRWLRGAPVVIDAALLFEAGALYTLLCRPIICGAADDAVRAARVAARDGVPLAQAAALLEAQMPQARKAARAHVVVGNDGSREALDARARLLARQIRAGGWLGWGG